MTSSVIANDAGSLPYEIGDVILQFTRSGTLRPWLGPALRGLTASRLKEQVCQHPPAERQTRWTYCRGCPHMAGCAYGETFEPDPPADAPIFHGQEDASRPLVLAPGLLPTERVPRGLELPLRITAIGQHAIGHSGRVLAALAEAGRTLGVGPEHITFQTRELPAQTGSLHPSDLPDSPTALPGVVRSVRVVLSDPLFLRSIDARGRRQAVTRPTFADLLRASLRTVGQLYRLQAQPLPADFAAIKEAALSVQPTEQAWQPFGQRKWSNRTEQRFELRGVTGHGTFGNVPAALLPWLEWGGRLHVGTHRVAGAGGWRVISC